MKFTCWLNKESFSLYTTDDGILSIDMQVVSKGDRSKYGMLVCGTVEPNSIYSCFVISPCCMMMTHWLVLENCKVLCNVIKWWVIIIQHGEISQHGEITMHEYIELCSKVPHTSTTWWNYKAWIYWIVFHGSTYQHNMVKLQSMNILNWVPRFHIPAYLGILHPFIHYWSNHWD